MLKIVEAIVVFLGGHLLSEIQEKHPHGINGIDLIFSKSRLIAIFLVGAITLPLLFVGGILLCMVGASHWLAEAEVSSVFHFYAYFGFGLVFFSTALACFGLSKKRFELSPEKTVTLPPARAHATQQIEQILVNVIKEFASEPKSNFKNNSKNSRTAADPIIPTSNA